MKPGLPLCSLCFLLCAANVHAELYKVVGPDGKITYSDTPPVSNGRIEKKISTGGNASENNFPYELSEAVKNNAVILYTSAKCAPCDDARKHLTNRGIPFNEKTVSSNDDIGQLRKTSGDTQLPLLMVGRTLQRGFEENAWDTALTNAGYPETSKLPKDYRNPAPESAAPAPKVVQKPATDTTTKEAATPDTQAPPPPIGKAPPGFRF
jgi:glutaredoxin